MSEAFVYDAIRTPRGRGEDTGSLHGTKPVSLVVGLLDEVRKRHVSLDPANVEDVILGCVSPIGEQGADIARTAALAAGYETSGPGFQLNRFCASGLSAATIAALEPSFAAVAEMGGFGAVALQKYHWVEKINHVHTPGNSSGIVDGASLMVIGSEQGGRDNGLTPRARIVSVGVVGSEPTIMLTGPAPATEKA